MYQFNLKGDMGRHHLSISGANSECGISTSTINRSEGKTFPPKVNYLKEELVLGSIKLKNG